MTDQEGGANVAYQPPSHEKKSAVLWIAFGLVLVAGLAASVVGGLFGRTSSTDVAALFVDGAPPAPWRVGSSEVHPAGTQIVRLERDEPATEGPVGLTLLLPKSHREAKRLLESTRTGGREGGGREGGGGRHGGGRHGGGWGGDDDGEDEIERWKRDPSEVDPFSRVFGREPVPFGPWEAPGVIVRTFDQDGTWTETLRLDLSQPPERSLVLVARWPADQEARPEELEGLLAGVAMLEVEED